MSKPENPPAFPVAQLERNGEIIIFADTCMTLRDWFAGKALNSVIECHQRGFIAGTGPTQIASTSYDIADAMLTEREKGRDAQ